MNFVLSSQRNNNEFMILKLEFEATLIKSKF